MDWYWILGVIVGGGVLYFMYRRGRHSAARPPYERAVYVESASEIQDPPNHDNTRTNHADS